MARNTPAKMELLSALDTPADALFSQDHLLGTRAAMAIWSFFRRPLAGGIRWSPSVDFKDFEAFRRSLSGDRASFVELCRDVAQLKGLTAFEQSAVSAVVAAYDSLALPLPQAATRLGTGFAAGKQCEDSVRHPRSEVRKTTSQRANLRLGRVQYRVNVHNVSNGGAMIGDLWGLSPGQKISLNVEGDEWTDAIVRWTLADRCGIEYDR